MIHNPNEVEEDILSNEGEKIPVLSSSRDLWLRKKRDSVVSEVAVVDGDERERDEEFFPSQSLTSHFFLPTPPNNERVADTDHTRATESQNNDQQTRQFT